MVLFPSEAAPRNCGSGSNLCAVPDSSLPQIFAAVMPVIGTEPRLSGARTLDLLPMEGSSEPLLAAWDAYRALRSDRRIGYLAEPDELPETWRAFTEGPLRSPNLWTGAYLCAFAQGGRLTLVTFDAKIPTRQDVGYVLLNASTETPGLGAPYGMAINPDPGSEPLPEQPTGRRPVF